MDENPLAPAPIESAIMVSFLVGLALAGYVLVAASRGRFAWTPAVVTALVAMAVPFAGPVVALMMFRTLSRGASGAGPVS